jgi:hypothetical protein
LFFSEATKNNYVSIKDGDKTIFVKVSTLCYIWSNKQHISPDRLHRFISAKTKPKLQDFVSECTINADVFVGDWCLFEHSNSLLIGQIIGFEYIEGKRLRKKYTFNVCPIKPPPDCANPKGVNVIANWFLFDMTTKIMQLKGDSFFVNVDCYSSHIDPPEYADGKLVLSDKSYAYIQSLAYPSHLEDPLSL